MQFRVGNADGVHLIHTLDPFQVFLHETGLAPEIFIITGAGDHYHGAGEAIRGGEFVNHGVFGIFRQLVCVGVLHFPAQVDHALVKHVLLDLLEAHQDDGNVVPAGAVDKLHIPDATPQRVFYRLSHASLHVDGGRARENGDDVHPVEIQFRFLGPGHLQVSQYAQQDNQAESQVRQDVVGQKPPDEIHGCRPTEAVSPGIPGTDFKSVSLLSRSARVI